MSNRAANVGVSLRGVATGGCVAGVILTVCGLLLVYAGRQDWGAVLSGVERAPSPFSASFSFVGLVLNLLFGLYAIWVYASIRPRYGAGPVTGLLAGFAAWFLIALSAVGFCTLGSLPVQPTLMSVVVFLIPMLLSSLVGAALYSEEEPRTVPVRQAPPAEKPARARQPSASPKPAPAPASTVPPVTPTAPSVTVPPVSPPSPSPPAASPVPSSNVASPASGSASPPSEAAAPAESDSLKEKQAELQESMVAMELNDGVAVREVLRVFGGGGMTVEGIVEQLELVRWNFGGVHPRVVVTNALKELLQNGKVKETGTGKWEFSR